MKTKSLVVAAMCLGFATAAHADPIEGTWKRPNGVLVAFAKCGAKFCATAKTGPHAGKSVGSFTPSGAGYKGSLTDLSADKTYTGKASISGGTLKMSGCVVLGLICKTESWARQ
jgi:autotransporter-associated beta strand protein